MSNIKKQLKYMAAGALLVGTASTAFGQTALRTAYFLDGYTYRHELNPAFAPERNFVSLPIVGNIYQSNSGNVGVNTFFYPQADGRLATFLHPNVDTDEFLGKIHKINNINENLGLTLASAGWYSWGGFNTVALNLKVDAHAAVPGDLFRFLKVGMDSPQTIYDLSNLKVAASAHAELALGHSRMINENLRVGAKLKFLFGLLNATADVENLDVTMSDREWNLRGQASLNIGMGGGIRIPSKVNDAGNEVVDWENISLKTIGLAGFGMGLDLGATYTIPSLPDLEISAALLDLSFLSWNKVDRAVTPDNASWTFKGFQNVNLEDDDSDSSLENQLDNTLTNLGDAFNLQLESPRTVTTGVGATFNLGAKYNMPFYRPLAASFLFTQRIQGPFSWTEGRFGAQVSPAKWFDAAISYGASTFGSSFGWIVNFHPKGFNIFFGSDHQVFKVTPQMLPVGNLNMNFTLGIDFTFGELTASRDAAKHLN